MNHKHINILSIGGGPGSDICGVLEHLKEEAERREIDLSVNVVRLDIEHQWDNIFNDVMRRPFHRITVNYKTLHLNINEGLGCLSYKKFDLITASYLISELSTSDCISLAAEINFVLADGGVLVINDRPEDSVENKIRSMLDEISMDYKKYTLSEWAGYNYRSDISNTVFPKLNTNSIIFIGARK